MAKYSLMRLRSFSLIELMVIITIVSTLAYISVGSYRDYAVRSTIAALIPLSAKVKIEVENEHNQGVIFGASGSQTYVASADPDLPEGLDYINRVAYGCVDVGIDLADLSLDNSNTLIMTWCPKVVGSSIEWACGYGAASTIEYVPLLPANCRTPSTSIRDTSF